MLCCPSPDPAKRDRAGLDEPVRRRDVAPPTLVNAIEDALSPFGVRIYGQHLPLARILELIAEAECS
jgi:hypothetical protein